MRVDVLGQVVLAVEALAALGAPVDLVRAVDDRVPLQMFLHETTNRINSTLLFSN